MKRLIILSFVLMFLGTTGVLAQDPPPVFGWDVYTIPEFPTNDSISLSASTDVNAWPPYNNQNSLQVDITYGGTGYAFIGYTFAEPITIPSRPLQFTNFVAKSVIQRPVVSPLIYYQGAWYLPFTGHTNLANDWYIVKNDNWIDIINSNPFPEDSITIENAILYFNGYDQDVTFILDTWYNPNFGGDPILYDGFGDIVSDVEPIPGLLPTAYELAQNYPNPFNPSTTIKFTIPNTDFVNLTVYNSLGQEISKLVNEELAGGAYKFNFTGANLPSGIYFYRIKAGNFIETRKMILLR